MMKWIKHSNFLSTINFLLALPTVCSSLHCSWGLSTQTSKGCCLAMASGTSKQLVVVTGLQTGVDTSAHCCSLTYLVTWWGFCSQICCGTSLQFCLETSLHSSLGTSLQDWLGLSVQDSEGTWEHLVSGTSTQTSRGIVFLIW